MKRYLRILLALCLCGLLTSCFDSKYDLDRLDLTVGSDFDLTLPGCSTGTLKLKNIINLAEDGVVQTVIGPDGKEMYVVRKDGSADIDDIKIDDISFDAPSIGDYEGHIDLREESLSRSARQKARRKAPVDVMVDGVMVTLSDEEECYYDINPKDAYQEIENERTDSITANVVSVEMIRCRDVRMVVDVVVDDVPEWVPSVCLQDMELRMPDELHVKSSTLGGHPAVKIEPGVITFSREVDMKRNGTKRVTQLELVADQLVTGEHFQFLPEEHVAVLNGVFEVKGCVRVSSHNLGEYLPQLNAYIATLPAAKREKIVQDPRLHSLLPDQVGFRCISTIDEDIEVTHVTGQVRYALDSIAPIRITGLPDFMNPDNAVLDLASPMLMVKLNNGLPIALETSLALSATQVGEGGAASVLESTTEKMTIKSGMNVYCFASNEALAERYMPDEYKGSTYVATSNLPQLLSIIPDSIQVAVDEFVADLHDFDIMRSYPLDLDYELVAPLVLGPNFRITYEGTVDDFNIGSSFNGLVMSPEAEIVVTAKVYSEMPVAMTLGVYPIDVNNQRINFLSVKSNRVPAEAQGEQVTFVLRPTGGHDIAEVLRQGANQMDGIHYTAVLDEPVPDGVLRGSAEILLKDIHVKIRGLVGYDVEAE